MPHTLTCKLSTQANGTTLSSLSDSIGFHHHHVQTHALQGLGATCVNTCCSGAFIQETMAGVILNGDVRELVFTPERMPYLDHSAKRTAEPGAAAAPDFNVPVVLTHLLTSTAER